MDRLPRHPVQIYEAIAYGILFLVLLTLYRRKRAGLPPGLLLGVFLTGTFGARFVLEFVKVRQAAFGHDFFFSMGQLLSMPLILLGGGVLYRSVKYADRPF